MDRIPVECIVVMNHKEITPLRIRYEDVEGAHVIKVNRLLKRDKKSIMASMHNPRSIEYSFTCEAVQGDYLKPFTLTYNDQSCRWHLYIN